MSQRLDLLKNWLNTVLNNEAFKLDAITNDASFRRYFRVITSKATYIAMDAPPDKEKCEPFIDIAQRLQANSLNAPHIMAKDLEHGFLLLTDLGSQLYLSALNEQQVEFLYTAALDALLIMQTGTNTNNLPLYNEALLYREISLFTDWLVDKYLQLSLNMDEQMELQKCFQILVNNAISQPQVFVHRDYHSRNLMVTAENNPGILDFQDAVKGAITYDLVSLLRDCYISWNHDLVKQWVINYLKKLQALGWLKEVEPEQFLRWFDLMGIQRHLKASGIFARLYHRDGKNGYLKDIPRTLNYIVEITAYYPELEMLHQLVKEQVLPKYLQIGY